MRVLLLALVATPALAQSMIPPLQPTERGPMLGRQGPTIVAEPVALALAGFDADQDGVVTRAEAAAGAARSFRAIAGEAKDFGYIGYGQWSSRWLGDANIVPGPFEVDADRDNRITEAEIAGALLGTFDRFDKDRDGRLTRAELVTIRATVFGDDRNARGRKPGK